MPATATLREPGLRFDEPVRSLLRQKGSVVWSIAPDATVYQAIEMMSDKRIGCLLVMVGGRLSGIVSERDYARKVILMGRSSQQTQVREIMSKPVLYVTPEQTLDDAMRLMTTRRIRHLPVLEGETVLGLLSIGDLLNWILTAQQHTIRQLHNYIAGQYPA
jgi:CBS domain-containing protein